MMKLLKIIEEYLFFLGLFLLPLIFIPVFPNSFETPKLLLLIIVASLVFLVNLIKIIISKIKNYIHEIKEKSKTIRRL